MGKFVVVNPAKESDYAVYNDAVRALCKPDEVCRIQFWTDKRLVPTTADLMTSMEADGVVADYTRNPSTGFEQLLVNCRIDNDPHKCFR